MMLRCGLVAADLLTNAHGPTYTFRKKSHSSVSYLDHCLVSQELLPNVSSCYVIDDNFENFSDHLPISIHLKYSSHNTRNASFTRVAWRRLTDDEIRTKYTIPVVYEIRELAQKYLLDLNCNTSLIHYGMIDT